MAIPAISESEWVVMEQLWKRAPQTASEVHKAVQGSNEWALNTVRTLLTRLMEKGALKMKKNSSGVAEFSPAVQREVCVQSESDSFLHRVFQGAADSLVMHFVKNAKLTPEEVENLKRMVDQASDKKK